MKFKLDYILNTFTSTNDITSYCLHSSSGHFGVMNYEAFRKLNEILKLNKKVVLINDCSRHSQLTVLDIGQVNDEIYYIFLNYCVDSIMVEKNHVHDKIKIVN